MTLKSLTQQKNKSIKITGELCHDLLKHFPVSSSSNRYSGVDTNTIPPTKGIRRPDFDYSAPNLIRAERTPGAVAVSGINGRELAGDLPLPASPEQTHGRCGAWAVLAECSSGLHHFAKRIVCGKEWCPECGQDDSAAHKRRQSRLVPKLQQVKELGYFVIEFPEIYRHIGQQGIDPDPEISAWCYSKADLRETTNIMVSVLAGKRGRGAGNRIDGYFNRGLLRWHLFGDKIEGKWNPHANVLVDGGYIEPEKLEEIKAALREALHCPDLIVNYSYADSPGKIMHKLKYVTRTTFKNKDWNPYMAAELFNFRNTRWWGKWNNEPAWELNQAEAEGADIDGLAAVGNLQEGVCPDCGQSLKTIYHNHAGQPVQWTRPIDSMYLTLWNAEEIAGSGYYRIPHCEHTGTIFSPDKVMEFTRDDQYVALLAYVKDKRRQWPDDADEDWWNQIIECNA